MINRKVVERSMTTGEFIRWYFEYLTSGFIEIVYLMPEGLTPPMGREHIETTYPALPLTRIIPDMPPAIAAANDLGYSIYFGTTPSPEALKPIQVFDAETQQHKTIYRRRRAAAIEWLPGLWCDIDTKDIESTTALLLTFSLKPNTIVKTGGGVHAYWKFFNPLRVTEHNRKTIRDVLHGIALSVDGDVKCRDLARIMRLPGTINTKPSRNGALCEVTHVYGGMTDLDNLHRQFHPFIPREAPRLERPPYIPSERSHLEPVTQAYLKNPPGEGERNQKLYAAARGCLDSGLTQSEAESLLMSTAQSTGLPEDEITIAIASAYRATRGAPTNIPNLRMAIRDRMLRHAQY